MMANEEHVRILKQGVKVWNQWRNSNRSKKPDLSEANLEGLVMLRPAGTIETADFTDVDLQRSILVKANLPGANFTCADLRNTRLDDANLQDANFNEARLSGAYLLRANLINAQFRSANLVSANMTDAAMDQVTCKSANLSGAILERAALRFANFEAANLSFAKLMLADLSDANIQNAIMVWADLLYSNLSRTNLRHTDFREATLGWTTLCDVDLSRTKDLHTVCHKGPSHIGIDTVYRSGGEISEAFLRGCGVPDQFILHARSLVVQPIQFYSCFISCSTRDAAIAQRLHADLQDKGVRCWIASEDMKIGDRIRPRIDESIRLHDRLLLVLSEHSLASAWVADEVEAALEKERRHNSTVLFPVTLDDSVWDSHEAWAAKVRRERHIGDFRQWRDLNQYQVAFERLLRDLKAKEE